AKDEFGEVPANVKTAPVTKLVTELFQLVGELSTKPAVAAEAPAKKVELPADYLRLTTRFKVLVVDDNYDNRVLAGHLLGADHDLMVVDGYGAAMQALDGQMFDAVLTDSQLPLDFYHRSLSDRAIKTTEVLQHQGQWIAFRATLRGANAAVVTDANHHQDWQSAVLDDFREPMEMNGHRLMFINNMGKRWDLALATLMLMK
ncbi:MAG: hypothetical protein NTY66_01585, partial [Candidatus Vogelbacteria bacterium]|nr:hypothetical protein [Candidatus Vogelbacteria bacterium]